MLGPWYFGNRVHHATGFHDAGQQRTGPLQDFDAIHGGGIEEHAGRRLTDAVTIGFILSEAAYLIGIVIVGLVLIADIGNATHVVTRIGHRERANVAQEFAGQHLDRTREVFQQHIGPSAGERVGRHPAVIGAGDVELGHQDRLVGGGRSGGRLGRRRLPRHREGKNEGGRTGDAPQETRWVTNEDPIHDGWGHRSHTSPSGESQTKVQLPEYQG